MDTDLERRNLAAVIVQTKEVAMRMGLVGTAQALETAVTTVGWEIAEMISKEARRKKERQR